MDSLERRAQVATGSPKCLTKKTQPVRNKYGKLVCTGDEQLLIWTKYFKDVPSVELTDNREVEVYRIVEHQQATSIALKINMQSPSLFEITNAIKILKSNKAAGNDNLAPF